MDTVHPCKDCLVLATCNQVYNCAKFKDFIAEGIKDGKVTISDSLEKLNLTNATTLNDFFRYWKEKIEFVHNKIPSNFEFEKVDELESNVDSLNREIDNITTSLSDLEEKFKHDIQQEIEAHGDSIENLETQVNDLEYDLDRTKENIEEEIQSEIMSEIESELDNRIESLQENITDSIKEEIIRELNNDDEILRIVLDSGEVISKQEFDETVLSFDSTLTEVQNMNENNQESIKNLIKKEQAREFLDMLSEAI